MKSQREYVVSEIEDLMLKNEELMLKNEELMLKKSLGDSHFRCETVRS